jgi:hypothetical protein
MKKTTMATLATLVAFGLTGTANAQNEGIEIDESTVTTTLTKTENETINKTLNDNDVVTKNDNDVLTKTDESYNTLTKNDNDVVTKNDNDVLTKTDESYNTLTKNDNDVLTKTDESYNTLTKNDNDVVTKTDESYNTLTKNDNDVLTKTDESYNTLTKTDDSYNTETETKTITSSFNEDNDNTLTVSVNDIIVAAGEGDAIKVGGNYVNGTVNAQQTIKDFDIKNEGDAAIPASVVGWDQSCVQGSYTTTLASVPGSMNINQNTSTLESAVGINMNGAAFQATNNPVILSVGGDYAPTSVPAP